MSDTLYLEKRSSPIGDIVLVAKGGTLCALEFFEDWARTEKFLDKHYPGCGREHAPVGKDISDALNAYFDKEFEPLHTLPVDLQGTDFQISAWQELRRIPPGETLTYGEQAVRLGNAKAMRAVGLANGKNPIAIAVPCHRVIGANGKLTGYAGGLDKKVWLLTHEGALLS